MSLNHLYHSFPSEFVILKKPKIVQNRPGGAGFYIESSRIFPESRSASSTTHEREFSTTT